jgi:hypothetical protein
VSQEEQVVETIPVDIEARQIVRWLLEEERSKAFDLLVSATRSYERAELAPDEERRLGEAEAEELSEINEVGLLEVMPRKEPSRWTLRVRVTDDIGPRMPDDEPVPTEDEEIDLATFNEEFIVADRGFTEVSAEAQDRAASAELARLVEAIVENRHRTASP